MWYLGISAFWLVEMRGHMTIEWDFEVWGWHRDDMGMAQGWHWGWHGDSMGITSGMTWGQHRDTIGDNTSMTSTTALD